jgi:DNA-binding MarR family transcriptional regulator
MNDVFQQLFIIYDDRCGKKLKESLSQTSLNHLTYNHYIYLNIIDKLGQPTLSEIAEELSITKPSVTVMINKLIKEKLVDKLQSPHDKRVYFVELSELGRVLTSIEEESFMEITNKIMGNLNTKEQEQLRALIKKGLSK